MTRRLAVDLVATTGLVGTLLLYLSPSALLPAAVAIGYGESSWPFLAAGAIAAGIGFGLSRLAAGAAPIGVREGYLVVALTWLLVAVYGAIPYLLSGEDQVDRPVDALFESMSGFTTTGSSVLTDVESLDRSLLIWRAETQWLGGMGIVVLVLAVLPRLRVGGRQLFESEMPGPEMESLGARVRQTARRLWILYVGITALEALTLAVLGWTGVDERMDPFRAVAHAFTTLPSGGFSTEAISIEAFSAATQWVVAFFMLVAGTNFALTYRALLRRDPRVFPRDEEFRLYVGLLVLAATVLTVELWAEGVLRGEAAIRGAVFQTLTIMTSTGYTTANFDLWPLLAVILLVGLMFIGGSAGSTSGSIKVVRHAMIGKLLRREMRQTVHPELVEPVRFNRAPVDERTLRAILAFVLLYMGIFIAGALLISFDAARTDLDLRPIDVVATTATAIGNVGPALGAAGPYGNFEGFSDLSSLVLIVLMWVGRLELLPVLVLLTRSYWRN
ncbi:MAG: TrkH family potassium uptake protein [Gaiellaceae bacterium]